MFLYEQRQLEKEQNPYYKMKNIESIDVTEEQQKRYISLMSSSSHTYGNALAFIQNWVLGLFPEDLFKTIHVNSKIAHRQIRNTNQNQEFIHKSKPMAIFRPRIAQEDESKFLSGTSLIERQTDLYNTWGGSSLQPFFAYEKKDIQIKYQLNRSVMFVDCVFIFSTLMQQLDYYDYIKNSVRIGHPFMIPTFLESYIPQEMLKVVSDLVDIPLYNADGSTKEFLEFMNQNSTFPITYKLQGSTGTREFYRYYPVNVDTIITDFSRDEGEKVGHTMNNYQITFTLRIEFNSTGFYYIFSDKIFDIKLPTIHPDTEGIIPVFTDIFLKEDLNLRNGWHLYNSASCMLEKVRDDVCIDSLINESIRKVIQYHKKNGMPLLEFLDIKVRRQGKLLIEGRDYKINYDTMTAYFNNKSTYYTYKFLICINVEYVNDMVKRIWNLK